MPTVEGQPQKVIIASLFLPYTLNLKKATSFYDKETKLNSPLLIPSTLGNIGLQNAINSDPHVNQFWVGLLGIATDCVDQIDPLWKDKVIEQGRALKCGPVLVSDMEFEGHYDIFCKQILWKPFHYQLKDQHISAEEENSPWESYVSVNQRFTDTIVQNYNKGDMIWINDYHLMLVPAMVRSKLPSATIGFFLHIPFPSSEIFRCIHVRKEILQGMLGSDLIGFQTYSFMRHFSMTVTRLLSLESTSRTILMENSMVSLGIFPIGINLKALNEKRADPKVPRLISNLLEKYANLKIIIGRDKNDYVKGVRQKMLAYELFLTKYPSWIGKIVLIQVALTTTEANQVEAHVGDVVTRINSKFGSLEYMPVVYVCQDIDFDHYLALLSVADACLITSLRDGMNLTSHEYVVCQEGKYSPLIISEFTGTYGSMGAAIRINPWDADEVASAINEALVMGDNEKYIRWKELYSYISKNTAQNYIANFITDLADVHETVLNSTSTSIPLLPNKVLYDGYYGCVGRRIFFLDDEGTIMPSPKQRKALATDSNCNMISSKLRDMIGKLTADPRNLVYVVSGRRKEEVVGLLELGVGVGAENGGYISFIDCKSKNGSSECGGHSGHSDEAEDLWESLIDESTDFSWKENIEEIFEYYTDRTPGSYIERREFSLVWHYGLADKEFGEWMAAECKTHIEQGVALTWPIHVLSKKQSIQVNLRNVHKGNVVKRVLEHHLWMGETQFPFSKTFSSLPRPSITSLPQNPGSPPQASSIACSYEEKFIKKSRKKSIDINHESGTVKEIDFICCFGDDRSDEYMFEVLGGLEKACSEDILGDRDGLVVNYKDKSEKIFISCTVGSKSSVSKWYLNSYKDVYGCLERLFDEFKI